METEVEREAWIAVLTNDEHPLSPQDLAELHGAAQRGLASFPTHPGLLFLAGLSRPLQTEADPVRSAEEFDACIHHAPDYGMTLDRVLWAFGWFRGAELLQQAPLAMAVDRAMGHLHLQPASDIHELEPFMHVDRSEERRVGKECVSQGRSRW